jgi:hypothetical protein
MISALYASNSLSKFALLYGQWSAQEGQYPNCSADAYKSASRLYDSTVNFPFFNVGRTGVIWIIDRIGGVADGLTLDVRMLNVFPISGYALAESYAVHS